MTCLIVSCHLEEGVYQKMRVRGDEGAKVEGEKEGCESRAQRERTSTRHASGPPTYHCTKSRMRSYLLKTPKAFGRTDRHVNFKRGGIYTATKFPPKPETIQLESNKSGTLWDLVEFVFFVQTRNSIYSP